jgi:hypothetical protein
MSVSRLQPCHEIDGGGWGVSLLAHEPGIGIVNHIN